MAGCNLSGALAYAAVQLPADVLQCIAFGGCVCFSGSGCGFLHGAGGVLYGLAQLAIGSAGGVYAVYFHTHFLQISAVFGNDGIFCFLPLFGSCFCPVQGFEQGIQCSLLAGYFGVHSQHHVVQALLCACSLIGGCAELINTYGQSGNGSGSQNVGTGGNGDVQSLGGAGGGGDGGLGG